MTAASDLSFFVSQMSLEWLLTDRDAFGLVTASPLQRAICRVADGQRLGDLAKRPDVIAALGGQSAIDKLAFLRTKPREITLISGVRTAKSLSAAALAVRWSQVCDVSMLRPGEVPRIPVLSLDKDRADVVFAHLAGSLMASPLLRGLLLEEPKGEVLLLRHPTGRPIEVMVTAGKKAGGSVVSRWLAGVIFDEFPRMDGVGDAVVNYTESRNAALNRLLGGAQIANLGSPYAPEGPAYDQVQQSYGHPTADRVVIKAPAWDMNPVYWTPAVIAEAKKDPEVYRTDAAGEFATAEEALYSVDALARAIRPECEPEPGHTYTAAMDPATRGNSWSFGVFTRTGVRKRMVCARQATGSRSEPLSPREVFRDMIAPECRRYGITHIDTDQYAIDALQDIAREFGLYLNQVSLTDREKTERFMGIKTRLELGDDIELVEDVRLDLQRLRKRVVQNGVQIVLPLTRDGRHCDMAPVVMLGIGKWMRDVEPDAPKEDPESLRMRKAAEARYGRRKGW